MKLLRMVGFIRSNLSIEIKIMINLLIMIDILIKYKTAQILFKTDETFIHGQ